MKNLKYYLLLILFQSTAFLASAQVAKFSARGGIMYQVDGQWGRNKYLHYTNPTNQKTMLELDAGKHSFIFFFKGATYSFSADIKAGEKYKLIKGKPLALKEGREVLSNVEFNKVSVDKNKEDNIYWLTEKTDLSKVALIKYNEKIKGLGTKNSYRLKRVNNTWGSTRFGFNSTFDGNFSIALSPGKHILYSRNIILGSNVTFHLKAISVLEYNFESGKKYTIEFESADLQSAKVVEIKE